MWSLASIPSTCVSPAECNDPRCTRKGDISMQVSQSTRLVYGRKQLIQGGPGLQFGHLRKFAQRGVYSLIAFVVIRPDPHAAAAVRGPLQRSPLVAFSQAAQFACS